MKNVVIIGSGIAGLAAGIYAQKAGLESVIYEKHIIAGGECTGWDRGGFHIDGCIHWLMGTKEGTGLNQIWKEVGALEDVEVYQPSSFVTAKYEGTVIKLHRDISKLRTHLIEVAPEDTDEIMKLCKDIECFYAFEPPTAKPYDLMNIAELIKLMLSMRKVGLVIRKLGKLTTSEYLEKFQNPAIRMAFQSIIPEEYSAYTLVSSLGTFISGNGGRPRGGSRALARRMEEKYKSLGGKVIYGKEVEKILVADGVATGVSFVDGTQERGRYILPACDTQITLQKLLGGKYPDNKFEIRYKDNLSYPLKSCVYVALGVDLDLSAYPEDCVFQTKGYQFEDGVLDILSIKHYCYEPSFSPTGKSVMIVYLNASYDWWKEKRQNYDEYRIEKERLAQEICSRIEAYYPELQDKIKTIDVATPLTYERYCGAYRGSWMAFGVTPKGKQLMHSGRIKGIKNLYMAGQWLMPPGGLPTALITGKWAIQRIMKSEK